MRNNIIIFSHNIHSFLKNEIFYAANVFQRVIVICPKNTEIKEATIELRNVELIFFNKTELYQNAIFSLPHIFEKDKRLELMQSIYKRKLSFNYFKIYFSFLAYEMIFKQMLRYKIHLSVDESKNWVFYSAWYYGTAYAVTQAKLKYKYAKTISLAHSFEVDDEKNPYTTILFRKVYHNRLDKLSFISQNVYDMYVNKVARPLNLPLTNTEARYLGTRKLLKGISKSSGDNVLRIVSCSHLVPIKRVELIFKTLDSFDEISEIYIEWTHIGSGTQMNYIKELIKNKHNKRLKVRLLGAIDNNKIHDYYVSNCVDLFINTSASEGIPVSIMEAIAYGIPVVATDVGGNSEIVKGNFGRLVSNNPTYDELSSAILSIISLPKNEKMKMRQNAIMFFEEYFNSDLIRNEFFTMIHDND